MARIDKDNNDKNIINVSTAVGVRGINDPSDVTVIQAMLNYLQQSIYKWTRATLPDPNGALDAGTVQAIFDYQQFVRNRRGELDIWVAKDGIISPFRSEINLLHKQQWTILAMNADCSALSDGNGHINAIVNRWPSTVGVALGFHPPSVKRRLFLPKTRQAKNEAFNPVGP